MMWYDVYNEVTMDFIDEVLATSTMAAEDAVMAAHAEVPGCFAVPQD